MATEVEEGRALLANDVRALVSQLNEKMLEAAGQGLDVEVLAQKGIVMEGGRALAVTALSVRILAEVQ